MTNNRSALQVAGWVGVVLIVIVGGRGLTYTNFMNPAAVPSYFTLSAGLDWRFGPGSGLRVGYRGDFASGYTSHGGDVSFYAWF